MFRRFTALLLSAILLYQNVPAPAAGKGLVTSAAHSAFFTQEALSPRAVFMHMRERVLHPVVRRVFLGAALRHLKQTSYTGPAGSIAAVIQQLKRAPGGLQKWIAFRQEPFEDSFFENRWIAAYSGPSGAKEIVLNPRHALDILRLATSPVGRFQLTRNRHQL